jgi:hypothetical protein
MNLQPIKMISGLNIIFTILLLLLVACGQDGTTSAASPNENANVGEPAESTAQEESAPPAEDSEPVIIEAGGEVPFRLHWCPR